MILAPYVEVPFWLERGEEQVLITIGGRVRGDEVRCFSAEDRFGRPIRVPDAQMPAALRELVDFAAQAQDDSEARLSFELRKAERIERLYGHARRALALAYRYSAETRGSLARTTLQSDQRIVDCLRQVRAYRQQIRVLRAMQFIEQDAVLEVCLREELSP